MKKITLIITIFSLLAGMAFATSETIAVLSDKEGKVHIQKLGTEVKEPVEINASIKRRYFLITGSESKAVIKYNDGSLIKINENTKIYINDYAVGKKKRGIGLCFGTILCKISKITKKKKFNVYTPAAVAGVRGTEFEAGVADNGDAIISVKEGIVNVSSEKSSNTVTEKQAAVAELKKDKPESISEKKLKLDDWVLDSNKKISKAPEQAMQGISKKMDKVINDAKETAGLLGTGFDTADKLDKLDSLEDDYQSTRNSGIGVYELSTRLKNKNKKNDNINNLHMKVKTMNDMLMSIDKLINKKFEELENKYQEGAKKIDSSFDKLSDELDKKLGE